MAPDVSNFDSFIHVCFTANNNVTFIPMKNRSVLNNSEMYFIYNNG